jgi:hypothetical protein
MVEAKYPVDPGRVGLTDGVWRIHGHVAVTQTYRSAAVGRRNLRRAELLRAERD